MKKIINFIKTIPWYAWLLGFGFFALEGFFYWTSHYISIWTGTIERAIIPKIDAIDNFIPLWTPMIVFYVLSYPFWVLGTVAVCLTSKKNLVNYLIGLTLTYIIGWVIYIAMPTRIDRVAEGILDATKNGKGLFNWLTYIIYKNDGGQYGYNLFPSYHCAVSIYCYFGVRNQKEIAKWYKIFAIVMTACICLSTVFTKQHYFLDVIAGLSIATIAYVIVYFVNPYKWIEPKFKKKEEQQEASL